MYLFGFDFFPPYLVSYFYLNPNIFLNTVFKHPEFKVSESE
jgi:hypothetical protein